MRFRSTRRSSPELTFSQALEQSLAPDGGLYVPERFPEIAPHDADESLGELATRLLAPFFEGDVLAPKLGAIARGALDFPTPLRFLAPVRAGGAEQAVLELFHGPTAAFKDVGARFLAGCVSELGRASGGVRTVLVATSGDTGGAVASAFHGMPAVRVFILFPKGKVSPRQEKQLTCWGGNVRALSVLGDFDDCQRMVKEAFGSAALRAKHGLLAANSISVGRLLPQMVYYAQASQSYLKERGRAPGFVIPTGNLGNAVAAFWARELGFPIREIVLATNSNTAIPDYLDSGSWSARPTVATLANAMDVGNPSNAERLFDLFPSVEALREVARSVSADDDEIRAAIRLADELWGEPLCPHTAAALHARQVVGGEDWIIVATAHPAKFETIVEPLLGRALPVPPALATLLKKEASAKELPPELSALSTELDSPAVN